MSDHSYLLTIAIPTYNRASDLDTALCHIAAQPEVAGPQVEVLVSDNCSTDATESVVRRHITSGMKIKYIKNSENIGPDNNFLQCFNAASGRYVWILGDDDIILDEALTTIIPVIASSDYGVVHVNTYGFHSDFIKERPLSRRTGYVSFDNPADFFKYASYFLTFISANIVNREVASRNLDTTAFRTANLIQLSWTFPAIFCAGKNAYIKEFCVAGKMFASGGYKLGQVFGHNLNAAMRAVPQFTPECVRIINRRLLSRFFPANIIRSRRNMLGMAQEPYFRILSPLFKGYLYFWLFTVPAIIIPPGLAYGILTVVAKIRNLFR